MVAREQLVALENQNRQASIFSLLPEEAGAKNSSVLEVVFEPGGHMPPHAHPVEEILLFLSGDGILFIGQEPHTVCAGVTIAIPAGTPHCLYNTGIGRLRVISFSPTSHCEFQWLPGLFPDNKPLANELPDQSSQDVDYLGVTDETSTLTPIAA
jgi:quercetin dioxygenase-like cupin family protein